MLYTELHAISERLP